MALHLFRLMFRNSLRRVKMQSLQRKVKTVTEEVKKEKLKELQTAVLPFPPRNKLLGSHKGNVAMAMR